MSIEIYYFSGTGNTLHVARELKKRLTNVTLVPIIGTLKQQKIKPKAEVVGIAFPIHAHTFPWIVKEFLIKSNLETASYIFALSTRECADKVFSDIEKLLSKRDYRLHASFMVNTPVNFIPVFTVPSKKEIMKLERDLQDKLDDIQEHILNRSHTHVTTGALVGLFANTLLRISSLLFRKTRYFGLQDAYYADENCTGCGICENICLSNKIELINNKPVWRNDVNCTYCFACISFCPSKAIQAKRMRTRKKERYHHPLIKPKDIAEQKTL